MWVGDRSLQADQQGLVVLGTPLGAEEYVRKRSEKRLADEKVLWDKLPSLPDLQSAWLLLLYCASPRYGYTARTLPPSLSKHYAEGHDAGMWQVLTKLLKREDLENSRAVTRDLATLPLRLGGCGLRSATRTRAAAYWASWADTLPMTAQRCPLLAQRLHEELESGRSSAHSLQEAHNAREQLLAAGYRECPTWAAVRAGARPPKPEELEPGEYAHGWQYFASSTLDTSFREEVMDSRLGRAHKALVRSQSGCNAGAHLTALPLQKETTWEPAQLRVFLLRSLRLPLQLDTRTCRCGESLDFFGDHRAACSNCGRLQTRAVPLEKMWRRVCKEAGGHLQRTGYLRETNLGDVLPSDNRRLECVVNGLPPLGEQLAVDTTLVSPLTRKGEPRPRADRQNGVALADARKDKERRYPELLRGTRCRLVVTAMEVGGRWSEEAYHFLDTLALAKAREAPQAFKGTAYQAAKKRWTALLAVAGMRSFANSLLLEDGQTGELYEGPCPTLGQLLGNEPHAL